MKTMCEKGERERKRCLNGSVPRTSYHPHVEKPSKRQNHQHVIKPSEKQRPSESREACWTRFRVFLTRSEAKPKSGLDWDDPLYLSVYLFVRGISSERLNRSRWDFNGKYLSLASTKSELGLVAELKLKTGQGTKSRIGPESESKAGPGSNGTSLVQIGTVAELELKAEQTVESRTGPGSESKAGPGPKLKTKIENKCGDMIKIKSVTGMGI
ncbi:hypothetical protein EVAR_46204_1 [Eumeta japonica]|uniref:Uncharacterized protein n=1 Tax=Eumeta variegata TaxID=151549 RepID=A0A4C1WCR1_EUMVA|nr:hypothetical protein EVAR_46204_1 [Eumeta japonica]